MCARGIKTHESHSVTVVVTETRDGIDMAAHPALSEVLQDYLSLRKARLAPTTFKNEVFVLRRFVAAMGDIQVRHLTPEHLERYFYGPNGLMNEHRTRDGRTRPPVAPSTHNRHRTRLKEFFLYCSRRSLTRHDLLQQIPVQRVPVKYRLQPSADLLWQMLDNTDCPRDRAILATAMNTGLRASEICGLLVRDVDLDEGTLHVTITKSRTEDRLPLTCDLEAELRRWLATYRTRCAEDDNAVVVTDSDYLFPAKTGPHFRWRMTENGYREQYQVAPRFVPHRRLQRIHRVAQAALASIGLETQHEGIHTIRRAVARHYFDQLCDSGEWDSALRMTSALLHHSNTSTTETYLGISKDRRARDASLRGKSLLGPRPTQGTGNVVPLREVTI